MKPLYYRSVSSKGAGRPRLTHHHKGWWNETKWMRWVWRNGGMKFVAGENGKSPEKYLPRTRFVHHETHMEWPRRDLGTPAVGGERLTACATRPPYIFFKLTLICKLQSVPFSLCFQVKHSNRFLFKCTLTIFVYYLNYSSAFSITNYIFRRLFIVPVLLLSI